MKKLPHCIPGSYYTATDWVWEQHMNCWTWKVKNKIFTFRSTNSYVARILVNNCFVIPFTSNIWLSNVCNAALRIIPNALNFDFFRSAEFGRKLISCNVAAKRFKCWTGRQVNIEIVRPFELKFLFGFFSKDYIEK